LSSNNNVEDSKTEGGYFIAFNKSKKPLKQLSNKPDLLLYNTDTIDHIVNDRKWFKDDYIPNKDQLRTLKIEGGLVISKGNSTTVFTVIS